MKLLNFASALVVLCGVFQIVRGELLKCNFMEVPNWFHSLYSCDVTSLDNSNNTMVITGHSGIHLRNKTDADVKRIIIQDTNSKYIPKNVGMVFNLTIFTMAQTQLVEIKSQDFIGMQNLKYLDLFGNKLTSLPIDAFWILKKLKTINLNFNQLEGIQNGVFSKNLDVEQIHLYGNKIKFLGFNLIDGLTKLIHVDLENNDCIGKKISGSTEIIQLKNDIQMLCQKSKEDATMPRAQNQTDDLTADLQ